MTLKGQNALRDVDRASFGAGHENLIEDRRMLSAAECSPRSLLSGGIRLMKILVGVAWQLGVKHSGVTKTRFFVISGAYNLGMFRAEAKVTIQRHEVVYRLSSERKMIDLE